MKTRTTILLLLMTWINSYAQDGSDIRYFKVHGVDGTLIGQDVHFDFFNRSFGGKPVDTISINLTNKLARFIEVRKDNGYNNWFSQQRLESIDGPDGQTIKISKFRLDSITSVSFQVTMYVEYYDVNSKLLKNKSGQVKYWFDKKDIAEVLVKSKQR